MCIRKFLAATTPHFHEKFAREDAARREIDDQASRLAEQYLADLDRLHYEPTAYQRLTGDLST